MWSYHLHPKFTKVTTGSYPVEENKSLRPHTIKLFIFSYLEGNKLPDCLADLSHLHLGRTNGLYVSIATSLHCYVTFSGTVHRLWDPHIHALAQTTLMITLGCTLKPLSRSLSVAHLQIHALTFIARHTGRGPLEYQRSRCSEVRIPDCQRQERPQQCGTITVGDPVHPAHWINICFNFHHFDNTETMETFRADVETLGYLHETPNYSCRLSAFVSVHITLTLKALHGNHIASTQFEAIAQKKNTETGNARRPHAISDLSQVVS